MQANDRSDRARNVDHPIEFVGLRRIVGVACFGADDPLDHDRVVVRRENVTHADQSRHRQVHARFERLVDRRGVDAVHKKGHARIQRHVAYGYPRQVDA